MNFDFENAKNIKTDICPLNSPFNTCNFEENFRHDQVFDGHISS